MSEQAIFQNIEEEILRNLSARHQRNDGTINMNDVINEASNCLAVNNLLSVKQLNAQTGSNMTSLPAESMTLLFKGMDIALEKHFKANFNSEHSRMIKERYDNIISNNNSKDLINNHYNELFGSHGGNVI
ncbi:hypothetical protein [Lacinutrix himadriensis]|uniref:hypothetical protein n=1 Tax=Lacinutrix himadriensis TaxID=641549 RepID=UPI0006E24867|nr:hypothetical protein [Lacinutrix himadriensis]